MNYKELFKDSMSLLLEPEVKELGEICEYWKARCILAEEIIEQTPCDPDITEAQRLAWLRYKDFISQYRAFMKPAFPVKCTQWENESYCDEKGKCLKCVNKTNN